MKRFISLLFFLAFIFSCFIPCAAQNSSRSRIKGKILNKINGRPISYASVRIPKRNLGLLADATGTFSLSMHDAKSSDTILISSVGYNTLKIPVGMALTQGNFYLAEYSKELENVEVKSYTKEVTEGSNSIIAGYYRSWNIKNYGGEIGRIFNISQSEYKIEKVRFKVNNQCDSCNIRIRIRAVNNGVPDRELFNDSISTLVKKLSFDDRASEFDLSARNIILKEKNIFISFELLNCYNKTGACSFCYIGTEPGNYLYRTKNISEWEEFTYNSIYLKLYYKY